MEERKLLTNFKAIEHKVYRNTTARRVFVNVVTYSHLLVEYISHPLNVSKKLKLNHSIVVD